MSTTNDHVAAFRKLLAANLADGWPVDWPAACCELVDAAEKAVNGLAADLAKVNYDAASYRFLAALMDKGMDEDKFNRLRIEARVSKEMLDAFAGACVVAKQIAEGMLEVKASE